MSREDIEMDMESSIQEPVYKSCYTCVEFIYDDHCSCAIGHSICAWDYLGFELVNGYWIINKNEVLNDPEK